MENLLYNHYIDLDYKASIVDGWSDGPHPYRTPTFQTVLLTDKGEYQFRLYPGGEVNPILYDMDGIPLYKYEDDRVVPRTEEEIAADRAEIPVPPPTDQERFEAQLYYTAMKTDTLIGE